jgi:hypothetical protein
MEGLSIIKAAVDDDDDDDDVDDEQQLLLAQPVVDDAVVVRGGVKRGWDDIVRTVILEYGCFVLFPLLLFLCDVSECTTYDVVRGEVPMKFRIGTNTTINSCVHSFSFVCCCL